MYYFVLSENKCVRRDTVAVRHTCLKTRALGQTIAAMEQDLDRRLKMCQKATTPTSWRGQTGYLLETLTLIIWDFATFIG